MHAKIIVGPAYGFIGSENFSGASVNHNPEVGVTLRQTKPRWRLIQQFHRDWQHARPLAAAGGNR